MGRFVPAVVVVGFVLSACAGGAGLAPAERFQGHDPAAVRDAAVQTLEEFGLPVEEASDSRVVTAWVNARDVECPEGHDCDPMYHVYSPSASGVQVGIPGGMARVVLDIADDRGVAGVEARAEYKVGGCGTVRTREVRTVVAQETRTVGEGTSLDPPYPIQTPRREVRTDSRIECGNAAHSTGRLERSILEGIRGELAGT